jgi:hypothetical protein
MISVRVDTTGNYHLRWPKSQSDIIALGVAYVAYESSLPSNKQLAEPSLTDMQTVLGAAQVEQTAANSGEASRAAAAENYRQIFLTVKTKLNGLLLQLKVRNLSNLAMLESWGVDTVTSVNGVTVRKPRNDREWVDFLASYVSKETSLDAGARITDPPLTEMTALNDALQVADAARKAGRDQREAAIETRMVMTKKLLTMLQAAAMTFVVSRFDGVVTNGLQKWGYEVVAYNSTSNGDSEPIP